jgi:hypothetical protein
MKSHMTQNCLDVLVGEAITKGCQLTKGLLGLRTWYFNSNKHECMRVETLGIYLLKYLHHFDLNLVMVNSDIQAMINFRTLKNKIWLLECR